MSKKILVVDDETDFVSVISGRLEAHGYETASAENGDLALQMIRKEKFDLIILDIIMPVMDGAELGQALKNDPKTKNIPLIYLTALGAKRKDAASAAEAPYAMFTKPFDFKELIGKIEELLNRKPKLP